VIALVVTFYLNGKRDHVRPPHVWLFHPDELAGPNA
jgi:hypothetical protein